MRSRIDYGSRLSVVDFDARACRPSEAEAVLQLWEQTRSGHATMPDGLADVQRLLSADAGSLLVADVNGAIIGALIAASDGWRGNMYRLAVHAEHRRAGIGSALVRAGERHLRRAGVIRVTALVAYGDDVAVSFWEAAGYPQDREIGRHVRNL
jgi:ribosomal protein S18 acetylase RimI-like enzyme